VRQSDGRRARVHGQLLSVHGRSTRYTSLSGNALSVVGVESARLVALKPLDFHGPRPAPLAVETIFVELAASMGQPAPH